MLCSSSRATRGDGVNGTGEVSITATAMASALKTDDKSNPEDAAAKVVTARDEDARIPSLTLRGANVSCAAWRRDDGNKGKDGVRGEVTGAFTNTMSSSSRGAGGGGGGVSQRMLLLFLSADEAKGVCGGAGVKWVVAWTGKSRTIVLLLRGLSVNRWRLAATTDVFLATVGREAGEDAIILLLFD